MRWVADRDERYAQLQQDIASFGAEHDGLSKTHARLTQWQSERGNLDALSRESGQSYLRLMRTLQGLVVEQNHDPGARARAKLGIYAGTRAAGDLARLREELVAELSRDLAEQRPAAGPSAELDPGYWPPIEPAEWKKFYEHLTYQVTREDELVHQRLTWMMQYEGFLFTAFGFTIAAKLDHEMEPLRVALLILIPLVGLFGAYAVYRGVRAAHRVLQSLKRAYLASLESYKLTHVRPFGRHTEQFASFMFPWILMCAWIAILCAVTCLAVSRKMFAA